MKPAIALFATIFALSGTVSGATDGTLSAVDRWKEDPTIIFDASEVDIEDFKWVARPIVVFADSEVVPAFIDQMELLTARPQELARRDVVLIVDTDPDARSDLRRKLRPRGFMLTLIGKDGGVKLRKPLPWDVRELSRSIDKMPMRRREMRDGDAN